MVSSFSLAARPFEGRRCVVTGGLGFIGANLVHVLAGAGARVAVVDALIAGHGGDRRNLDGLDRPVEVVVADIGDEKVEPVLAGSEYIFNVAGQVSHLASMIDPLRDLDLNARGHLAFLERCRQHAPAAVIVHTSTRQVYGRPRYLPVDEDHPTEPVDVNGIDKLAGEQFHRIYARVHGLHTVALRLTNVYGPRQNLSHDGLGFLPTFVRQALRAETISVYGDGQQERDCLHVDDVVRALLLAATSPDTVGEIFNLGHSDAYSLLSIAHEIVKVAASGSRVETTGWPPDHQKIDIGSFHGDYAKAKRLLGWEPLIGLAEGLVDTLAFYRDHPWYLSLT